VADYVRKGGVEADTVGRKCVCNGLLAAIGLARVDGVPEEPALLTAGVEVANIVQFVKPGNETYSSAEVVERLLKTED